MESRSENSRIHVGLSPIHGKGLFASLKLSSGELIGTYDGEPVSEDGMHVLWVEDDDGQWIAFEGRNDLRYLNHSDEPNAEMDGLHCYAMRDIMSGEEITIDYGWNEQ